MNTNTNFTLYPYTLWILLAAIVIALIFLFITLKKLSVFSTFMKSKEQELTVLGNNAKYTLIKTEVIEEESIARRKNFLNRLKIARTLLAAWLVFGEKDEKKGRKGIGLLMLHQLVSQAINDTE